MADIRRAVRDNWVALSATGGLAVGDLVLVACSGGADSVALADAVAFEGTRAGYRLGAIVVDHGLQHASAEVAEKTGAWLRERGFAQVFVVSVEVGKAGGTEAAARDARYAAFASKAREAGARAVLLAHTLNDQAETVLLGLARGSGARSIAGMRAITASDGFSYLRPLLEITREQTEAACQGAELSVWNDPMNDDREFARVRVRKELLPEMERELGPGVAAALARTADMAREDADFLDALCADIFKGIAKVNPTWVELPVEFLAEQPPAIRNRLIAQAIAIFGTPTTRVHVLAIAELVTDWHGQKELALPGIRVSRTGGSIHLKSARTLTPGAC
ncbi:MAG: hypothetical protein RL645_312 [Actinomycetota bacterium]|jgi:tRNA(Ile)-lysidine synthase